MVIDLKKKPLILIAYIFAIISFVFFVFLSFVMPSNTLRTGSIEAYGTIVSVVLIAVFYFDIKQGISSGGSFFRLADVNLLFTAPVLPVNVLIYGFIKQFFKTFIMLLFMSFQIPNLKNNFSISAIGVLIIYITTFFLFLTMPIIGMLIYSITSKSKRIKKNFERVLNIFIFGMVGAFLLIFVKTGDFGETLKIILNSDYFLVIPYIGWFKNVLMASINGVNLSFYLNVLLIIISTFLMVIAVYKMRTDYYEDVLAATERMEEFIVNKKEGKGGFSSRNIKVKNVKHTYSGYGAKTIFLRHMLEYKKTGLFFINRNTIFLVIIGLGAKFFLPFAQMNYILYFSLYILFFFSLQGKWVQELNKPYIYLMPANSAKKVFFATLAENLKNGVDGLILFIAVGFMLKSSITVILFNSLIYLTYGAIYTYTDVLSRRIFGATHGKNFEIFMKMILVGIIIVPAIVIDFLFDGFGIAQYIFIIMYNLLAAGTILFASKGIFDKLEMK